MAEVAPLYVIGSMQPGGVHHYPLNGFHTGFRVGSQATGQMKGALDAAEAFIGTQIEVFSIGAPNTLGSTSLHHLDGVNRFVVFSTPLVPLVKTGSNQGSVDKLIKGQYDTGIQAFIASLISWLATQGRDHRTVCLRAGWEFIANYYPWCDNWTDQNTGSLVGLANLKLGQAHFESVVRTAGFTGWIDWCGGTSNSALAHVAQAMPTHGNPAQTIWGYDLYMGTGSLKKNDPVGAWNFHATIYDEHVAYCRANGYLYGHGEYGGAYSATSPYFLNDNDQWHPLAWAKMKTAFDVLAYVCPYFVNQPDGGSPTTPLYEEHCLFLTRNYTGQAATVVGSGPDPVATTATVANSGSLQYGDLDGLNWVNSPSPNKVKTRTSWLAYFGGSAGRGAGSLQGDIAPPVTPPTPGPVAQLTSRHPRVYTLIGT